MPKRFYGVQSDCEVVILAGYAYFLGVGGALISSLSKLLGDG